MALTSMSVVGQPSVLYLRRSQPSSTFQPGSSFSTRLATSLSGMTGGFSGMRHLPIPALVQHPLLLVAVEVHMAGHRAVLLQEILNGWLALERLLDRLLHGRAVVAVQLVEIGVLHVRKARIDPDQGDDAEALDFVLRDDPGLHGVEHPVGDAGLDRAAVHHDVGHLLQLDLGNHDRGRLHHPAAVHQAEEAREPRALSHDGGDRLSDRAVHLSDHDLRLGPEPVLAAFTHRLAEAYPDSIGHERPPVSFVRVCRLGKTAPILPQERGAVTRPERPAKRVLSRYMMARDDGSSFSPRVRRLRTRRPGAGAPAGRPARRAEAQVR